MIIFRKISVILLCYFIVFRLSFAEDTFCTFSAQPSGLTSTDLLVANNFRSSKDTLIYQAYFDGSNYQGDLIARSLRSLGNSRSNEGVSWHATAGSKYQRRFFSINPSNKLDMQGIKLSWEYLNDQQREYLTDSDNISLSKKRLAWLLGSKQDEGTFFRKRDHFLGAITTSNISLTTHRLDYGYSAITGEEGGRYATYLKTKLVRQQAVFVGANDGALHAFDASNGKEIFAYFPNNILPKIATISRPNYGCNSPGCLPHEFLVEGKNSVADAYFDKAWHTVLIGSLGRGGKSLYALDVTDLENFNEKNILWEVSNEKAYKDILGFIDQEANIVRLKGGRWVAIVGNGFGSANHQAVLLVIDLETGHLIKSLSTHVGSITQPNGLSTPISIDLNVDTNVDRVYAGDLLGNIWRFNLADENPEKWSVAFSGKPLFRACEDNECNKPQAVTAKLQVGEHPDGGVMIYFGTHQTNNKTVGINSFYAIRDNNTQVRSNKDLVEQEILQENNVGSSLEMRVTTDHKVDYKDKQGWFLKLIKSFTQQTGEQVTTQAILREGQLIVSTEIPTKASCSSYQSKWLMKFDALQGKRLSRVTFDTNHDNKLNTDDNADYERQSTIVSGVRLNSSGIIARKPVILSLDNKTESIISVIDDGSIDSLRSSTTHSSGRVSWRQLH